MVSVSEYRKLQMELFAAKDSIREMQCIIHEKDELINALRDSNVIHDDSSGSTIDEEETYDCNMEESSANCDHREVPRTVMAFQKRKQGCSYAVTSSSYTDECYSQTSEQSELSDDSNAEELPHQSSSAQSGLCKNEQVDTGGDANKITVDVVGVSPLSNSIEIRCSPMKEDLHRMFPMPRARLFGLLFVLACSFQCYFVHLLDADAYTSSKCLC